MTVLKRYKIYVYLSLKTQIMDINNQLAYIYYLAYHIVHIVSWYVDGVAKSGHYKLLRTFYICKVYFKCIGGQG